MANELWPVLEAAGVSAALSVAVAALAIALLTHCGARMFASSVARRTAWQAAIVATLGCLALEFSGIGQATVATLEVIADPPVSPSVDVDHRESRVNDDSNTAASDAPFAASEHFEFVPLDLVSQPIDVPELLQNYGDFEDDGVDRSNSLDGLIAPQAPDSLRTESGELAANDTQTRLATAAATSRSRWVPGVLAIVWCIGSLWFIARVIASSFAIRTLVRRLPQRFESDEAMEPIVRQLATLLGMRRQVRVRTLPEGCSPLAFGLWQPTIGLPADFVKRFTAPQRRAILAHELEHLAAGDPFWRLLGDVLLAALWWHPAAWTMRRQLIVESERVADEASRAIPGGPEELAAALVVLGKRLARRRHASAAYGAEGDFRSSLGQRVERLLAECDRPWRPFSRSWLAVARAACGVATIVCVISLGYWTRHHLSSTQGEVQMKTFMNTWRQSLAGVTLAMLASGPVAADTPATDAVAAEATVAVLQEEGEKREEGERRSEERPDREGDREGDRDEVRERRAEAREERREAREERREGERPDSERPNAERAEARRREAQEIKGQVEQLQNRLRELGDKNPDESRELNQQVERLMNRIRELRMAEADRPDRERPDGDRPDRERADRERPNPERAEARRREAQELKGQVERLRNRIRELGDRNPEESRAINQQVERLMNRIGELSRAEGDRPDRDEPVRERPDRERPDGDRAERDRPRPEGDRPGADRREREIPLVDREIMRGRHLKSAIDHLRAGGMHDAAERLERDNIELLRRVDRRRPDFNGDREPRPDGEERRERPREERAREDRPREERDREERPRDGDRRPDRPDGPPRDGDRPPPGRPGFEGRPDGGRPERDRPAADLGRMKIELQKALADREQAAAVAAKAEAVQQELQKERAALHSEVEKLRAQMAERDAEMQRKLQELQTREQQSRAELEKQKSWTVAAAGGDAARAELAQAVAERGRIELELSTVKSPEAREARMAEFRAVDEKINQLTRQLDAKHAKIREGIAREILRDPKEEMKEEITAERAKLVTELRGTSEQVSKLKAELKRFTAEKAALEADGAPAEVLAAKEAEVLKMREVLEQLKMQEAIKEREIERHDFNVLTRKPRRQ